MTRGAPLQRPPFSGREGRAKRRSDSPGGDALVAERSRPLSPPSWSSSSPREIAPPRDADRFERTCANQDEDEANDNEEEEESRALQSILDGSGISVPAFFQHIWQHSCALCRYTSTDQSASSSTLANLPQLCSYCGWADQNRKSKDYSSNIHAPGTSSSSASSSLSYHTCWDEQAVGNNPHEELIRHGWSVMMHLLEHAAMADHSPPKSTSSPAMTSSLSSDADLPLAPAALASPPRRLPQPQQHADGSTSTTSSGMASPLDPPLLFRNQVLLKAEEKAKYGASLWAAFLDGCSIVLNHADMLSPWIAALCQDLQRSFPHAYANVYLTPTDDQAVPPHADDRDVLIVQVWGRKVWTVYKNIPVPFPYPHEQVGKEGLPVPEAVLQGPVLLDKTLQPGDVLYMPRGYVHQARTPPPSSPSSSSSTGDRLQPSFHVTIALSTQDWSWAGQLSAMAEQVWTSMIDFRKAVPRTLGTRSWSSLTASGQVEAWQQELDRAMDVVRQQITVESLHQQMQAKYQRHNQRAVFFRNQMFESFRSEVAAVVAAGDQSAAPSAVVVGRQAAARVHWMTRLRPATPAERASTLATEAADASRPRGLHVRECTYPAIMAILQRIRPDAVASTDDDVDMTTYAPSISELNTNGQRYYPRVADLLDLLDPSKVDTASWEGRRWLCDLTMVCFARQCVELGALAIVYDD